MGSLNRRIKEAPWFYAYYFFDLTLAGTVVLIPHAPLVLITLFVQVIATTLLPAALVFLILLLNDEETMGKYRNTLFQINSRYAIPSIRVTPLVRLALGLLRFYLLFLVGLMIYKFIVTLR